ncbi:hypothetical protein [Nesterenkonia populi]
MSQYASKTQVPVGRSQDEIGKMLSRYGAGAFGLLEASEGATVEFSMKSRRIRFIVDLPDPQASEFIRTPTGRARTAKQAGEAHEQAVRQRWRALALVIKAKLEVVESGIVGFDEEFLGHIVLPSGRTVSEEIHPQIEAAYGAGEVAALQIERVR